MKFLYENPIVGLSTGGFLSIPLFESSSRLNVPILYDNIEESSYFEVPNFFNLDKGNYFDNLEDCIRLVRYGDGDYIAHTEDGKYKVIFYLNRCVAESNRKETLARYEAYKLKDYAVCFNYTENQVACVCIYKDTIGYTTNVYHPHLLVFRTKDEAEAWIRKQKEKSQNQFKEWISENINPLSAKTIPLEVYKPVPDFRVIELNLSYYSV